MIDGARQVRVQTHRVDALHAKLAHHIEVGRAPGAYVFARAQSEAFAQRNGYSAVAHRSDHFTPQHLVFTKREFAVAVRVVVERFQAGGDVAAAEIGRQV